MPPVSALLALVAGSLLPAPGVPTPDVPAIPESALTLGGVSLGDSEADVRAKLGRPLSRRTTDGYFNVQVVFSGLTVWLDEDGQVAEILSTGPRRCTPQGVCPGQRFDRVRGVYGTPRVANRENGRFFEYDTEPDTSCWLQMAVASGRVRSIRTACAL